MYCLGENIAGKRYSSNNNDNLVLKYVITSYKKYVVAEFFCKFFCQSSYCVGSVSLLVKWLSLVVFLSYYIRVFWLLYYFILIFKRSLLSVIISTYMLHSWIHNLKIIYCMALCTSIGIWWMFCAFGILI